MAEPEPNPLTMVYAALYDMARRHSAIRDLVKPANWIWYNRDVDGNPLKSAVSSNDFPEVALVPAGQPSGNIGFDSSQSQIMRRYSFVVSTSDFRVNEKLFCVEWYLLCALADWQATLSALTWKSNRFVVKCQMADVTEGLSDSEKNRGIKGWSAIWACDITMVFRRADLKAELLPIEE